MVPENRDTASSGARASRRSVGDPVLPTIDRPMRTSQQEIDERSNLTRNNQFELLLFRLGEAPGTEQRELYGINVFKVREILEMPHIVPIVGAQSHVLGVT